MATARVDYDDVRHCVRIIVRGEGRDLSDSQRSDGGSEWMSQARGAGATTVTMLHAQFTVQARRGKDGEGAEG
jgi:hypothetical protein